jgi:small-conductance mechanosensitive channel
MEYLEIIIYNQYFRAFIIVLIAFLLAKIITFISKNYLKKWAAKSKTSLDDLIVDKLRPPFIHIIVLIGLQIAISTLETGYIWIESLVRSITALFLIYAAMIVSEIIISFLFDLYKKKNPTKMIDSLSPLLIKTIRVVLIIVAIIWVLSIWQVDITPLLAGAGIASFVIGFAMQDTLKNIFGGISMILEKSLEVGDRISLDSGEMGLVEEVSIRSTKIRTFNNELLTIPNGRLADSLIKNYTKPNLNLRVVVDFSVVYGSDTDKVKEVVEKTIKNMPDVNLEPPVSAIMVAMADSGLNWQVRFWVSNQGEAFDKKIEALDKIYKALNQENIGIPFPTRTVYLKKDDN